MMRRELPCSITSLLSASPSAAPSFFFFSFRLIAAFLGHVDAVPANPPPSFFVVNMGGPPEGGAAHVTDKDELGNAPPGRNRVVGSRPTNVILTAAPYTHLLGLYSSRLALCAGAANPLLPAFSPPGLLSLIARGARPSLLPTARARSRRAHGDGAFKNRRSLSSLGLVISPAAAAPVIKKAR